MVIRFRPAGADWNSKTQESSLTIAAILDAEGNVDATAQANRSVDAGGGYTTGAWEEIFGDVAADLVSDLKASITGVKTD